MKPPKLHAQQWGLARCNGRIKLQREPERFATSPDEVTCATCTSWVHNWKTEDFVEVAITKGEPLSRVGSVAGGARK